MATNEDSSHPILKEPVLYVVDPPKRVKWLHILEAFNPCGSVTCLGKTPVDNQPNRKKWTIQFPTLFQAEMALATLQGCEISKSSSPWTMVLSHSPTLESALPPSPLFPQFVKHNGTPLFMGKDTSPQAIFRWFRQAGPLVSVRTHVNVGYSSQAVVVQYWNEEHANKARLQRNALHAEMARYPAFEVRTFDPCNLYCAGFGATFTHQNFLDAFSEFGQINKAALIKTGVPGGYGFISFMTRESAAAALQAMNGKVIDGTTLIVRYHESNAQDTFRPWNSQNSGQSPNQKGKTPTPNPTASPGSSRAGPEPDEARQAREGAAREEEEQRREAAARAEQQRGERIAQQLREAAERRAREAAERRARESAEAEAASRAEAKTRDTQARREAAERAEMLARKNVEAARIDVDNADLELLIASEAKEAAEKAVEVAKIASAEAKRVWLEAMEKEAKAERQARGAQEDIEHAEEKKRQAEVRRRIAEQEEISFREKKERIDRGEEEVDVNEEQERLDALAEKIKRMEELKRFEKEEKEAREKREREAKKAEAERLARERQKREKEEAERRRREQEEAERLAREQREREEQARRHAENLRRLYRQAASVEHARCLRRDLQHYGGGLDGSTWTTRHAYRRFVGVSEEFDTIKFHETTQPLTFHSIPWPVLHHPHRISLDDIQGSAVNKFFAAVKAMQTQAEYMTLIKKARNRFHPDRWRSRGILASVLDENLRSQLEAAGNEVSKQINHLWDKRT